VPRARPGLTAATPHAPRRRSPAALVSGLEAILEDSAASMRGAAGLASEKDKATWWRTRLALDERLAALLQHAGRDWLGPWRCLLAQPAGSAEREAELQQAAAALVAEQFDFVFGADPGFGGSCGGAQGMQQRCIRAASTNWPLDLTDKLSPPAACAPIPACTSPSQTRPLASC
jgi:hypothetical protein